LSAKTSGGFGYEAIVHSEKGGIATMNILVTGAAGFVGSHLCERLLQMEGTEVVGLDVFVNPSLAPVKQRNIAALVNHPRFRFIQEDLLQADLPALLQGVDVVYHLAGMPGVRSSWGSDFQLYVTHNILATQRLLEAARMSKLDRFIYVSTSSVYGEKTGQVPEDAPPVPLSPYGVSKLAGEHLCNVYRLCYGVPIVILRYFTVYGPRQRSDMAFHLFIHSLLNHEPITVFGDGRQTRDFTYVADCVEATAAALTANGVIGETINIGGLERASVLDVIAMLERLMGEKATLRFTGNLHGEPRHTWADISKAERLLGYRPVVSLAEGLARQIADIRSVLP
jgi:UDP-glucuronate 4-epimerase